MPIRYGAWKTVYGLFRRWQRDGTWKRILKQLQARADADGLITWDVSVAPPSPAHTSMPPAPEKRSSPTRTARRCRHRTGRPRTRTLPGRTDDQAPSRGRTRAETAVPGHHRSPPP
ncbi:hypothetical protein [Streptomyces mirabilis]|uniref:hypothetical protein n=1 Tax=Streptomyces mirabilis TaxID=68239 RepID=UPI0036DF1589